MNNFPNLPTLGKLKSHILSLFRPVARNIFGIHDPAGIHYLFQLRMNLSPLRSHKKLYNFADTPTDECLCGHGKETTFHFLFTCPLYAIHRGTLAANVIQILRNNNLNHLGNDIKIYLYGHYSMNDADNKSVLLSTVKYLKDTQRFSK